MNLSRSNGRSRADPNPPPVRLSGLWASEDAQRAGIGILREGVGGRGLRAVTEAAREGEVSHYPPHALGGLAQSTASVLPVAVGA